MVLQALSLIADHGLRVDDLAERQRHPVRRAPLVEALDDRHAFALGLREVIAVKRIEHGAAGRQIKFADDIRAPQVQVHRALVDRRVRAGRLDHPQHLA